VFVFDTDHFSEIENSMLQMAQILGESSRGQAVVDRFKKSLAEIRQRGVEHAKNPKHVLIQLDEQPLIVAGGKSFLTDALNTVGAKNVYADADSNYPRPSPEDVLKRNPDTVLIMAFGSDLKPFQKMARRWAQYPGLAANQKKQVTVVYADALLRPSLRLLEGLAVLEKTLYGTR
jgi:ABC-type Fe3+-hydroxamate transport system substrate-binding protein